METEKIILDTDDYKELLMNVLNTDYWDALQRSTHVSDDQLLKWQMDVMSDFRKLYGKNQN